MFRGTEPIKVDNISNDADFLQLMRERASLASWWWEENFRRALNDLNFQYESQWTMEELAEREGRPSLEMNHLVANIDQVVGQQRKSRISIKAHAARIAPNGGKSKMKSAVRPSKDYDIAEVRSGLIKNIEVNSDAESQYDMAFQHAVESGFGWLRVYTAYADDDGFDQDVKIKAVRNRFAVLMDPVGGRGETDFSNADWCFIIGVMKRKEFDKRYPGANVGGVTDQYSDQTMTWYMGEDIVTVAEYFYREPITRRRLQLSNGKDVWYDEIKDIEDEMAQQGIQIVRERKVKTHRVMWCKCTGTSILEKPVEVPFATIPVVPVFGKEATIKDVSIWRGVNRYAIDAQRAHNYATSAYIGRIGLAPLAPWILDARSIEGFENIWSTANRKNWNYLPYRHKADVPPPSRTDPPPMPVAEMQVANQTADQIKTITNLHDASLGAQSNETSGKAILARQEQGDTGAFSFQDNLAKAIRRVGLLCNDAINRIYDGNRIIRIMFPDGGGDWIEINQVIHDEETGRLVVMHDINEIKCDITVSAGAPYQTQREEAAENFMAMIGQTGNALPPQITALLTYAAMRNWDAPGMDDILKPFKKLLQSQGVIEPDDDAQPQQPQPPSPAEQVQMAQVEADKAGAEATKAMAQAKMAEAEVKMTEAQNAPMLAAHEQAGKDMDRRAKAQGDIPPNIEEVVRDLVAEAIAEFMAQQNNQQQAGVSQPQPQSM